MFTLEVGTVVSTTTFGQIWFNIEIILNKGVEALIMS